MLFRKHKVAPDNEGDAAYDQAARVLVFEAKAHAGERTLSPEELAQKEQERLQALERERLKRMRGEAGAAEGEGEEVGGGGVQDGPKGGYAAKRQRMEGQEQGGGFRSGLDASGDALDENWALSEEDEGEEEEGESEEGGGGLSALDQRRQERAAGDHPLQERFREMAALIAAKHGVEVPAAAEEGEEDEGEEEEGEEEVGGSEEREAEELEEEEEEGEEGGSSEEEGGVQGAGAAAGERQAASTKEKQAGKQQQQQSRQRQQQQQQLEGPLDLPYTIPVPETYEAFAALVAGRPAEQLQIALHRIRAYNASTLATDNKRKLQVLYGILVQHYAMLAGQTPLPNEQLDVLFGQLLVMTREVPYYAATVARARLGRIQERLAAAAADPLSQPLHGWFGPRQLLQLRLFSCLFPVSDKRHPVVTPVTLLLGKCLGQCPVTGPVEAAVGLLVAGMLLGMEAPAQRYTPEVYTFLTHLLWGFVPTWGSREGGGLAAAVAATGGVSGCAVDQMVPSLISEGVLSFVGSSISSFPASAAAAGGNSKQQKKERLKPSKKGSKSKQQQSAEGDTPAVAIAANGSSSSNSIPPLRFSEVVTADPSDPQFTTDSFKLQLLGCLVATASHACHLAVASCGAALPEVLRPLVSAARAVAGLQGLPEGAGAVLQGLVEEGQGLVDKVVVTRVPVVQAHRWVEGCFWVGQCLAPTGF